MDRCDEVMDVDAIVRGMLSAAALFPHTEQSRVAVQKAKELLPRTYVLVATREARKALAEFFPEFVETPSYANKCVHPEMVRDFLNKLDQFNEVNERKTWTSGYKHPEQDRMKAAFAMQSARSRLEEALK